MFRKMFGGWGSYHPTLHLISGKEKAREEEKKRRREEKGEGRRKNWEKKKRIGGIKHTLEV